MKAHKFFLFLVSAALAVALFTGCSGTTSGVGSENEDSNNTNQIKPSNVQFKDYKFKVSHLPHDSEGLTVYARTIVADKYYYVDHFGKITNYTPDTCITGTVSLPAEYTKLEIVLVDMSTAVNEDDEGDAKYYALLNSDCYNAATDTYEFADYYEIWQRTTYATQTYYGINEKDFKPIEFGKEYAFDYQTTPYLLFYADDVKRDSLKAAIQETKYTVINSSGEEREETTYTKVYWSSDITKIMSYDKELDYLLNYNKQCKTNKVYIMVKPFYYDYKQDKGKNTEVKVTISLTENETPYFDEGEYKLKFINLPYGSDGLKIVAKGKDGSAYSNYDIGAVVSSAPEAYIEKTIEILEPFETMNFNFVDSNNIPKYYIPLTSDSYDAATGVYVIKGYYYYYYDDTIKDTTKPYAACSENYIEPLEFDVKYDFNTKEKPFRIFKVSNAKDKIIRINKTSSWNIDLYASTDKAKILTYNSNKITDTTFYECTANEVYFMVKPNRYDFESSISITFIDVLPKITNTLEIDKAYFASDGYLYVSGTNSSVHSNSILFRYDIETGERTQIKNFYDSIITISEVDEGKLYISHDTSISVMDLATGTFSTLVSNLPNNPTAFVNYKDNKLVISGRIYGCSYGAFIILDKQTGNWKEATEINMQVNRGYPDLADEMFYFSDLDLFIHTTEYITSEDLYFTRIVDEDTDAPKYYSMNPDSSNDYDCRAPLKILSQDPLQFLCKQGSVFAIHPEKITPPTDPYEYVKEVKGWCTYEGTPYRTYNDCYLTDDYIYYMRSDITEDICTVLKCARSDPKEVIEEKEYKDELGIKFFFKNNKLYLLANGTEAIYWVGSNRDYEVFLHEIDF